MGVYKERSEVCDMNVVLSDKGMKINGSDKNEKNNVRLLRIHIRITMIFLARNTDSWQYRGVLMGRQLKVHTWPGETVHIVGGGLFEGSSLDHTVIIQDLVKEWSILVYNRIGCVTPCYSARFEECIKFCRFRICN